MRTLLGGLACGALLYVAGAAQGQESGRGREDLFDRVRERVQERIQDLALTDDQEAKIAEIRKEYRTNVEASAKELATLVRDETEKVRAVLSVEQLDQLQEMNGERKERRSECLAERIAHLDCLDLTGAELANLSEIRNQFRPKIAKTLEVLQGQLSEEQKMARQQALEAGKKRKEALAALKLTEDQKETLATVGKQLRALVREELEDVRNVLTPEQQEKITNDREERRERVRDRQAHAICNCKELNLSEEQKRKITAIREEYRPKVQEAGNKLRAAVREELQAIATALKA